MPAKEKVKVGIIGSGFEADIHAASFQIMPEEAEVVAVASPTLGNAKKFAERYNIPRFFTDYKELIAEKGFDPAYGARPLRRTIQKLIEDPLSEEIIKGRFEEGGEVKVSRKGDELVFSLETEEEAAARTDSGE